MKLLQLCRSLHEQYDHCLSVGPQRCAPPLRLTEESGLAAQAIFHLPTPWAAVEKAQGLKQVLGRGAAEEMLRQPERLLREFRIGEERVRHIVLGSPLAPKLATTPPAWARSAPPLACATSSPAPGEVWARLHAPLDPASTKSRMCTCY